MRRRPCASTPSNAEEFLADAPLDDPSTVGASPGVDALRAAGRRPGGHAMELPALAGHPLRRPGAHGGQRRPAQACLERAAGRALPRHALRAGGLPRRVVPHPADRRRRGGRGPRRSAGQGGHPDGFRAGGALRSLHRRATTSRRPCWNWAARTRSSCMPSADVAAAAATAVRARINNNGQSCIAGKRFIVHTDVYDAFAAEFAQLMSELVGRRPAGSRDRGRAAGHRSPDATSWPSSSRTPAPWAPRS